jgi:hypothetical protein
MFNESQLNLYAFLLGTWHFIIMNRPDNRVGIATYKSWHNALTVLSRMHRNLLKVISGRTAS